MTSTYSGDPASSDLDEVRFYLSDTGPDSWYLSDQEITFLIERYFPAYGSLLGVAAMGAEVIAGSLADQVSVSADGVSVSTGELQQRFNDLATSLRDQMHSAVLSTPVDNVDTGVDWDPSIDALVFGVGFHDNLAAGLQNMGNAGNMGYRPYGYDPNDAGGGQP